MDSKKVVVVLSGGMDSATLLYDVLSKGHTVHPVCVNYGQRHSREIESALKLCDGLGLALKVVDLSGVQAVMGGSSQTDPTVDVPEGHYEDETMRLTVVPNRNMVLLSVATAYAVSVGADAVAYGAHAGDHAIYPDCRTPFVTAMTRALQVCDYRVIDLWAPYLSMDKGDIAIRGLGLGVPYELTWTCYKGEDVACGRCGACQERLEAFAKAGKPDPLPYQAAA